MLEDGECEVHEFGAMMFNKLKASAGLSDDEEGSEGSSEEEEEKKPKTWSEKAEEKKMKESGPSNVLELEKLEGELKHRLRSESDERLIEMMNQQHSDSDSDGGLEKQIRATEEKLDKNPKCLLETTYWEVIRRHPTYFPHRRGCHVQFLVEGKELFENVYKTLMEAKELIYIVGWAVTPELKLCRDDPDSLTLGELLKKKAAEGVHVALHLWDETLTGLNMVKRGLYKGMETGDEETRRYFKHTGVRCNLSRRLRTKKGWNIPASVVRMAYSHHQKNIICDMPSIFEEDKRMLVSFIGGIDLTTGRWDTPDHPLFYTLDREHKNDFYCAYPGMDPTKGPRMPWHDVACKVFGRAVIDLLRNFEQRWRRQPKYIEMVPIVKRLRSKDGHPLGLYRFDEENMKKFSDLTNPEKWEEHANRLLGRDVWSLQVTRSIDSKAVRLAKFQGSDISIQEAYVKAIGKAKKFIYIENQFFCGSSEWWNKPHYGCTNSVPIAIVDTICEKIRRGEMMRVYIVIPLFPDSGRENKAKSMEKEATLPQLWKEASRLYRLAEKENGRYKEAQDLYSKVAILVSSLRLTSNNEELEDFGTKTLRYIALPYLLAQCIYNLNCPPVERVVRLKQTESYLNLYLEKCEKYKIMNPTDQKHYKKSTNLLKPEEKRALLKDQLQRTKDIEVAIATLEKKRQSRTTSQNEDQDDDDLSFSDEEDEREYILNLLGLYALRSISDLRSIESELPLAEEMAKRMANPTSNGASSTQDITIGGQVWCQQPR
eukprot:TRINITY_DN1071_c0_g1_i2.p1 TRINITY_DN1071_c0_g1~~TRINITY_DN1071_c0_g1_i2.p1  ORF type:complete len:769 (+),score=153.60 TRINITY_DN1071_c0_g1_i2:129-2435(+)